MAVRFSFLMVGNNCLTLAPNLRDIVAIEKRSQFEIPMRASMHLSGGNHGGEPFGMRCIAIIF